MDVYYPGSCYEKLSRESVKLYKDEWKSITHAQQRTNQVRYLLTKDSLLGFAFATQLHLTLIFVLLHRRLPIKNFSRNKPKKIYDIWEIGNN